MEVLDRANDKWEDEIDMCKLIQKMRWMERILKMALPKDKLKMSKKLYYNVIDLDSTPEDSSDSHENPEEEKEQQQPTKVDDNTSEMGGYTEQ